MSLLNMELSAIAERNECMMLLLYDFTVAVYQPEVEAALDVRFNHKPSCDGIVKLGQVFQQRAWVYLQSHRQKDQHMSHRKARIVLYPAIAIVAAYSATLWRHKVDSVLIYLHNEQTNDAYTAANNDR